MQQEQQIIIIVLDVHRRELSPTIPENSDLYRILEFTPITDEYIRMSIVPYSPNGDDFEELVETDYTLAIEPQKTVIWRNRYWRILNKNAATIIESTKDVTTSRMRNFRAKLDALKDFLIKK
jgi:hypothetical protein